MSTPQIPTFAQLVAARKILWHQGTVPAVAPVSSAEDADDAAVFAGEDAEEMSAGLAAGADEESVDDAGDGESDEESAVEDDELDGADGEDAEFQSDSEADDAEEDESEASDLTDGDDLDGDDLDGDDPDGDDPEIGGEEVAPVILAPEVQAPEVQAPASAAVRTIEAARALLERAGLMPFVPHPALSAAPSPSFVEATMGQASAAPTLEESATARLLLARMVAEGSAVPLNLLGQPGTTGEAPDFVVSTNAFPYIFTLRGDKGWKQLPETSGPNKVSPLAVNTYGLLVENGPQTAYALTGELGKGLTETAVVRALTELWQQLRVIPVAQAGGKPTVWEPITARLLRQIKAGANAGQPTALSALVSLYLGQVLLATEDEIEVFLSTVAPRSRVRDVVHALMAAQQLESMAIAGKQNVHLAGELPDFAAPETEAREAVRGSGPTLAEDGSRIRRMVKSTRPDGERAKPFRAERAGGFERRPAAGGARGARPGAARTASAGFAGDRAGGAGFARGGGRPERGARPAGGERPAARFDRPWEENKRPSRAAEGTAGDAGGERPRSAGRAGGEFRPQGDRFRGAEGGRPGFGRRQEGTAGDRPRSSFDREGGAGARPGAPRFGAPRPGAAGSGAAGSGAARFGGPRPGAARFGVPAAGGFGGRDAEGGERRRPAGGGGFSPRGDRGAAGEGRSFRAAGRDARPDGAGERPRRDVGDRPGGAGEGYRGGRGEDRGARGDDRGGARGGGFGGARGAGDRAGGFKAGGARAGGFRPAGPRPERGGGEGDAGRSAGRPPFRKFDAPRDGERPFRPARRPEGAEGGSRGFGGGDRPSRPAGDRGFAPRPGAAREGGARPFRPAGGSRFAAGAAGDSRGPKRPFVKREGAGAPRGPRPAAGRDRGATAPGEGPFDKFKDGNKPWGKRPPKRKIKPEGEEG